MSSTIKVNNIQNLAGDDSGIDLSTNDQIILKTANTTAITVNSSQNVALASTASVSGLLTASSGVAIGGTGSANTLDDYEEGTWTAELRGATTRATTPVTQSTASYVKIGTTVYVQAYFSNVNTSGASGTFQITGLPFTSINQLFPLSVMTFGQDYDDSTAVMSIHAFVENGTTATLIATKDNSGWQTQSITAGSGKYVAFQGMYLTS